MPHRQFVIGVICVASIAGMDVLHPSAASQQNLTPTFRSGVRLIEVDVVVSERDGSPVRDLALDDFEIIEDGRPQQIRTISFVDLPVETPTAMALDRDVEGDIVTNTIPVGRTYVLLVDTGTSDLRARHVAERWLDEVVQPTDRVAVVHVRGSFKDAQAFTSSRRLILDSINRMLWGSGGAGDVRGAVQREIDKWRTIEDISERLGTVTGRRKAIVWIVNPPPNLHPQAGLQPSGGTVGRGLEDPVASAWGHILAAWRDAARAAVNNNVAVYPVDPRGLEPAGSNLISHASMREVAEETGGVAVGVNTNDFSRGFATIVRDTSTYYLLGYTPEPERTDGEFHPIQVRVKREGVTVRARRGYYAADPKAPPPKPPPAPPEGVSLAARDALRKPVATPGLGIDVTTTSFRSNGKDASVVITVHVRGQRLEFDAGRRLAVSYQVFDLEGNVATGFYKVYGFNLGSESKARATGTGLQFVERISLKPGRYELRLVAEQPGGPMGSVVAPLEAGTFEGDLELSGVALASRGTPEVLLVGDRTLRGTLPAQPTALRSFRTADGLSAYAEVYTELDERMSDMQLAATRVATFGGGIATLDGAIILRGQSQRVSAAPAGKMLREGFRTDFDLSRLTPGRYVLMIEAASGRDRKRAATKQIPFDIVE